MAVKKSERVLGHLHDLARLEVLPADDCHVLLVSSRTLYLLANFALMDVNFIGRYAKQFLTGGRVDVVEDGDPEAEFVDEVANRFRLEVIPVTCDLVEVLDGIRAAISHINVQGGCGCPEGTIFEPEPGEEPGSFGGDDDQFETPDEYFTAKCQVANLIWETVNTALANLEAKDLDTIFAGGVTIATGLIVALIAAGPLGWAITLTAGVILGIANLLFQINTFNLPDMLSAWQDERENIICALYSSSQAQQAKDGALLQLTTLNAVEIKIIALMMTNTLLNQLFTPDADTLLLIPEDAFDCATCGSDAPCSFQFATTGEPPIVLGIGAFRYDGISFDLHSIELSAGVHIISFNILGLCDECNPPINWCVRFTATTITTGLSASWTREIYCVTDECAGLNEGDYTDEFPPLDTDLSVASAQFSNPTAFTITMVITGQLPPCSAAPEVEGCPE